MAHPVWKILMIDDDEEDYLLTRMLLADSEQRGSELVWASSYDEGCVALHSTRFDAVLLDYDLGKNTGLQLIRDLAAEDYRTPMILYTGRGSYEEDIQAMQAGATLYLSKAEVNPLLLERSIRYAIERKHVELALAEANQMLVKQKQELEIKNQQLSYERDRLRTLIESIGEEIWLFDEQGQLLLVNPAVAEHLEIESLDNLQEVTDIYNRLEIFQVDGSPRNQASSPVHRSLAGEMVAGEEVIRFPGSAELRYREYTATPFRTAAGQILGAVIVARDVTGRKKAELELQRAQEVIAQGIQEHIAMEERQRLARELHDSVSQALYGISLGAHTALTLIDNNRNGTVEAINYILSLAQSGMVEMRALIFDLRPESLEMEGLVVALTKQARAIKARYDIEVGLNLALEPDVPLAVKEGLFRIAQEAMQNAVKHARPQRLDLTFSCESGLLSLEVCDNGVGFDTMVEYPGHLGLRSMRERAAQLGARLVIESTPNCGTQIRVKVPVAHNGVMTP